MRSAAAACTTAGYAGSEDGGEEGGCGYGAKCMWVMRCCDVAAACCELKEAEGAEEGEEDRGGCLRGGECRITRCERRRHRAGRGGAGDGDDEGNGCAVDYGDGGGRCTGGHEGRAGTREGECAGKVGPAEAVKLNCAGWPAERDAVVVPAMVGLPGAVDVPVPLTVMDCGELAALSVMSSVVVRTPAASGVNEY